MLYMQLRGCWLHGCSCVLTSLVLLLFLCAFVCVCVCVGRASGLRPWIIAGGHRPLYSDGGGGSGALVEAVEGLFQKYVAV
jgi:hypothetical protein